MSLISGPKGPACHSPGRQARVSQFDSGGPKGRHKVRAILIYVSVMFHAIVRKPGIDANLPTGTFTGILLRNSVVILIGGVEAIDPRFMPTLRASRVKLTNPGLTARAVTCRTLRA